MSVIYSGLQEKESGICADTSLILANQIQQRLGDKEQGIVAKDPKVGRDICNQEIAVLRGQMFPENSVSTKVQTVAAENTGVKKLWGQREDERRSVNMQDQGKGGA